MCTVGIFETFSIPAGILNNQLQVIIIQDTTHKYYIGSGQNAQLSGGHKMKYKI